MAYRFFGNLMLLAMIAGFTEPSVIFQEFKSEQIIHYSQMKNVENISDYVVYLNEGDKIPLKMTLDSELLDIAHEEINLVLKQKVYFRYRLPEGINAENESALSEEDQQTLLKNVRIFLSSDAKNWTPYTDIKAVEQVFGLEGGSISFGMGITKEDGLRIFLNAKTNSM